jgi:eukaryotic-like serine/threonine-protein kinase
MTAPRVLVLTDDGDYMRLVLAHLETEWPRLDVRMRAITAADPLPEGFVAAGYDVVLLDAGVHGQAARDLLADLAARAEFPPIVLLAPPGTLATAFCGGLDVTELERWPIERRAVIGCVARLTAARREARLLMRSRADADRLYRFGTVTIRGHRPVRRLAQGGMASVYLAESERAGELVALKVLDRVPDTTGDHADLERFLDEYQLLAGLEHPNVVRIHELGIADDHAFIAMEYFPRGSLRSQMHGPLHPMRALDIAADIAAALDAVHMLGILHRDLKPGNVMLRQDGSLAIIDFGLADLLRSSADTTLGGAIRGTPEYMSPEQGHGEPLDVRSDLYSLGVVLYELLTGRRPYSGDNPLTILFQHRNAAIPALPAALYRLTPLLTKLLAKSPAERYASAREAMQALAAARAIYASAEQ